jgi:hypothetical protein
MKEDIDLKQVRIIKEELEKKILIYINDICNDFKTRTGFGIESINVYFQRDHSIGREKAFNYFPVEVKIKTEDI